MPLSVVGADDPVTRAALLAHVAGCDDCREALREFEQAANTLGQIVPQIRPRAELRARTLSAITGLNRAVPASPTPEAAATPVSAPATLAARTSWAPWLAVAASILAAVSIAGLWQTRGQLAEMRTTLAVWQARVAEAERSGQVAQATLVTYRRQLDVMSADDLVLISLAGLPPAAAAQARALVSPSQNAIFFSARGLPTLPQARVYQLWAIVGGQAISAGTFVPDVSGRGELVVELQALTGPPDALAVTVEPEGGVPAPTGPKYLLGAPAN
jgi:hypothetical protein